MIYTFINTTIHRYARTMRNDNYLDLGELKLAIAV